MGRKYVTVTLSARVAGDRLVILDVHGKRIAVVPSSDAIPLSEQFIKSIELRNEWKAAFSGMLGSLNSKRMRMLASPWDVKIKTWMVSLRHRRNRKSARYGKNFRYSDENRKDWSHAIKCLLAQYNNKLGEYRLRNKNPWRLWAQTVAGNHRKKGCVYADSSVQEKKKRGEGYGETIATEAGQPRTQLQLHWNDNDACSVIA